MVHIVNGYFSHVQRYIRVLIPTVLIIHSNSVLHLAYQASPYETLQNLTLTDAKTSRTVRITSAKYCLLCTQIINFFYLFTSFSKLQNVFYNLT